MQTQGRRFCCTIWDEWLPIFDSEIFSYGIFGWEHAPETGRGHWQGYVETFTKRNYTALAKKLYCETPPHFEPARGTLEENQAYCRKDGDVFEFGTPMHQGERTDLKGFSDAIYKGEVKLNDFILDHPTAYHQFGRTLEKINDIRLSKLEHHGVRETEWIWGAAGVGKTRYVMQFAKDAYIWQPGRFQEYNGEDVIIIEEFRIGTMEIREMLMLTDPHYSNLFVDRKNHSRVRVVASKIFITSNFAPTDIYVGEEHPQLLRRLKVIKM